MSQERTCSPQSAAGTTHRTSAFSSHALHKEILADIGFEGRPYLPRMEMHPQLLSRGYEAWVSKELNQKFREKQHLANMPSNVPIFFSFFSQIRSSSAFLTTDMKVTSTHCLGKTMPEASQSAVFILGTDSPEGSLVWGMCQKLALFSCLPSSLDFEVVPEPVSHTVQYTEPPKKRRQNTSGLMNPTWSWHAKAMSYIQNTMLPRWHTRIALRYITENQSDWA